MLSVGAPGASHLLAGTLSPAQGTLGDSLICQQAECVLSSPACLLGLTGQLVRLSMDHSLTVPSLFYADCPGHSRRSPRV